MASYEEIKGRAVKAGFIFTDALRQEIAEARETARLEAESAQKRDIAALSTVERTARNFNRAYAPALNGVSRAGDLIVAVAITLIVALGSPAAWVFVFLVEIGRVAEGIALFIHDSAHAAEAAVALIIVNTVFEVSIHFQDRRTGGSGAARYRFSLQLVRRRLDYLLGRGPNWQAEAVHDNGRALRTLVTLTILTLTTLGAISPLIAAAPGNWRGGAAAVLSDSSLADIVSMIGNFILGLTLIYTGQGLARFMVLGTLETMDKLVAVASADNRAADQAADQAAADVLTARYRLFLEARHAPAPVPTLPIGNPPAPVSGVSGNTETQGNTETYTEPMLKALTWYRADPARLTGNHRADAPVIEVSESTAYRARQIVRSEQPTAPVSAVSGVSGNMETQGNTETRPADEPIPPSDLPTLAEVQS